MASVDTILEERISCQQAKGSAVWKQAGQALWRQGCCAEWSRSWGMGLCPGPWGGWWMRTPCLQQGPVKVSGTLVPTSEVGRLCYPEVGPHTKPPPPEGTDPSTPPPQLFPSCRGQDSALCHSALAWPWRGLDRKNRNRVLGEAGEWPFEKLKGPAILGTHTPVLHQPGSAAGLRAMPSGDKR